MAEASAPADLTKVDSAAAEPVKKERRRPSSMAADVYNIEDLGEFSRRLYPAR